MYWLPEIAGQQISSVDGVVAWVQNGVQGETAENILMQS
jgi:hypothetical protein